MFSSRTGWNRQPNALARALENRAQAPRFDLTAANPTQVGFPAAPDLLQHLSDPGNAKYDPLPTGSLLARSAVCDYYDKRGSRCRPEDVWLTASTSEAYLQLLALACDPGDAVAVPRPGYPLFDFLADVAGVRLVPYPLGYDGRWHVDLGRLREVLEDESIKAVVCVAPSNPTGAYLQEDELEAIESICTTTSRILIVDEVFSDYTLRADEGRVPHVVGPRRCATFVLSGLSKVAALPQIKLAWGVACGPNPAKREALERLAHLNDTFLSASTPAQNLVAPALEAAPLAQASILQRVRSNLATLRERLDGTPLDVLDVEGGWSSIVRLPSVMDDVAWSLDLLGQADVLVSPGSSFDVDGAHAVLSLLTPPLPFIEGTDLLAKHVARVLA